MRTHQCEQCRTKSGFTLVEALMAIGLSVLLSGILWSMGRDIGIFQNTTQATYAEQQEVIRMMRQFTAESRTASPSSLGAYPIVTADPNTFTFYSDSDGDTLKERIRYFLSGTTVQRGIIVPSGSPLTYNPANEQTSIIVRNVQNGLTPMFRYYDAAYEGTTAPLGAPVNETDVRLVSITIVTDPNGSEPPNVSTHTTQVSLRNLKDN